jgi:superfamily II DNA helicase RecQ
MPTMHPLIWYKVDEVADVDNEIVRQIIKWDCEQTSTTVKVIVYCLTRQSVKKVTSNINDVAINCTHLHTRLDMDTKQS